MINQKTKQKFIIVPCTRCSRTVEVDSNCIGAVCWKCTMKNIPVDIKNTQKSDKPQGWKLMPLFVDKDGNVFERGVEQPEKKNTLPSTNVEEIKQKIKEKRLKNKKKRVEKLAKKDEKLVKEYNKKKELKKRLKSNGK